MARGGVRGYVRARVGKSTPAGRRRAVRRLRAIKGLRGNVARRHTTMLPGMSLGAPIQRFQSTVGNLTRSTCAIMSQRPSKQVSLMKRVGAPNFYTGQYPLRVDAPYGFQEINSWGLLRTGDLASLQNLPIPQGGSTLNIANRICVQSYVATLTCANASTAPVELEIYDIGLKRDIPTQIAIVGAPNAVAPSPSYTYLAGETPTSFWQAGSQMAHNEAPVTSGVGGRYRNVAASPFDSALFKDYFYVKKRTQVMLSQGGIHRHTLLGKVNKVIDASLFGQKPVVNGAGCTSNMTAAFKGFTSFVMVVQKGLPVSDASTEATVTTSDTHVDYILDWRYKWTYVLDNSYAVYNADGLTSPASGQIINVGNGLPEPIAFTA